MYHLCFKYFASLYIRDIHHRHFPRQNFSNSLVKRINSPLKRIDTIGRSKTL